MYNLLADVIKFSVLKAKSWFSFLGNNFAYECKNYKGSSQLLQNVLKSNRYLLFKPLQQGIYYL